jgi:hypothetical protein
MGTVDLAEIFVEILYFYLHFPEVVISFGEELNEILPEYLDGLAYGTAKEMVSVGVHELSEEFDLSLLLRILEDA